MSQQYVLVLNCGSSSLKFAIIDPQSGHEKLSGLAECLGLENASLKYTLNDIKQTLPLIPNAEHTQAITILVQLINEHQLSSQLIGVGHRVVHGGEQFTRSVIITDEVISAIAQMSTLAPLHNPANLIGIQTATKAFNSLPQIAVFDTAFHQTMPSQAYLYALPYSLYKNHAVRRYGFHGTSHYFVSQQAAKILQKPISNLNFISAHLGNGCSITAIKSGKSVDTSMGLTPLEGLMMGTRSGDVDPGLFTFLASLGYTNIQIDELLNKKSGLLGLSELSNDCRIIEEAYEKQDPQAILALDVFCYRLAKYIASYTVPLGQLDAIIFTGGIGENSSLIREKVINLLTIFGLSIDHDKNLLARFGQSGIITNNKKGPQAIVIPTNEEWVIALDTATLVLENK
ncbi:acetate kinase [Pseudoalteromonas denitrificans]|uniref:Acetate kinase n=1 Tax=Pseudoalteromonas denitrificans DSM 6059 TaxID=1123010 RepID=A0A1I1MQV8_9GAMM|nr:acetate kinase [Pseudoalteromonas denitrificans]SFC87739.1 acetate kinase [Pseudoalteromonas denitrificans DSM 6059]